MRPTINFHEGNRMRTHETVLFEECPLCGQAKITLKKPRILSFSKPKINSCPKCSAEFVARGEDRFKLVFCEPHKLVGKHNCRDRVFRGCYLDAVLSKSEWEKIAQGGESLAFAKFLEIGEKFRRGLLPACPLGRLPFTLEHGEIVHYLSTPVYLGEQKPSKGKTSDKGAFFLTNNRIIFVYAFGKFVIPLEIVERVEDSPPGFLVKEKVSFEPHYFFPPPYDLLFDAVLGAIHNFKEKH